MSSVGVDTFPDQDPDWINQRVRVCFDFDASKTVTGTVVRCDSEAPGRMIIKLDNGRYVLSTECNYQLVRAGGVGS